MATFIITRHAAAVEFARESGFDGATIVPHAGDDFWSGLKPGDVVVGTLPIMLAARACELTKKPFGFFEVQPPPDMRGKELTLDEMRRFGAKISWWHVEAAEPPKSA